MPRGSDLCVVTCFTWTRGQLEGQTFTKLRLNESRCEGMFLNTFSSILFVSGADS